MDQQNSFIDFLKTNKILVICFVIALGLIVVVIVIFFNSFTKSPTPAPTPVLLPTSIPNEVQQSPISPTPTLTIPQQQESQTQADKNYGAWQKGVDTSYPWYNNLPLQTPNYFVYFDLDTKKFVARLYPSQSSPTSVDTQVAGMKSEITAKLQGLGIDTSKFELDWQVTPEQ